MSPFLGQETPVSSSGLKRAPSMWDSMTKEGEKKNSISRKNSYSTDQGTQDIEKTENPRVPESSLVFIIRRYSKKHQRFILLTRHRNLISKCEHVDEEYYAKGMCKNCYHNKGERSKFATKCGHTDRFHYARGLCKGCYLSKYHKNKKTKALEASATQL